MVCKRIIDALILHRSFLNKNAAPQVLQKKTL
jgi:hypothetical protein